MCWGSFLDARRGAAFKTFSAPSLQQAELVEAQVQELSLRPAEYTLNITGASSTRVEGRRLAGLGLG